MRIAATAATLLFALASCSTTESNEVSPFQQPNQLMTGEINQRIEQIPYQHRDELLQNLLWLSQTGEQTIPALLNGLDHASPKVRSSCAWVLGRLRDRRTIDSLQGTMRDSEPGVRLEAARSLVLMGDLEHSPTLIEGLDSDRKEVRYLCHEALKTATGHDYGYDHLNQDQQGLQVAVLRWRQWWGEYSGDRFFAQSYQQKYGVSADLAAPGGETKPAANMPGASGNQPVQQMPPSNPNPQNAVPPTSMPATGTGAIKPAAQPVPPTKVPATVPQGNTGKPVMPVMPAVEPGASPITPSGSDKDPSTEMTPVKAPPSGQSKPMVEVPAIKPKPVVELPVVETPEKPVGGPGTGKSGTGR